MAKLDHQTHREGQTLFEQIFPARLNHRGPLFTDFSDVEIDTMRRQLERLRAAFEPADFGGSEK